MAPTQGPTISGKTEKTTKNKMNSEKKNVKRGEGAFLNNFFLVIETHSKFFWHIFGILLSFRWIYGRYNDLQGEICAL